MKTNFLHDLSSVDAMGVMDEFVSNAIEQLQFDGRFVSLLQHGSHALGQVDQYSDIDLTCIVADGQIRSVLDDREKIVKMFGSLVMCKTAPIGEGRQVLFCLFSKFFLRVDIVFSELSELMGFKEEPLIVWDNSGGKLAEYIETCTIGWPRLESDDLDSRFWLCLEQAARRLGRGELFEVLDILAVLRAKFLGPMLFRHEKLPPNGTRKLENKSPYQAEILSKTVASYDKIDCIIAINHAINLYIELRADDPPSAQFTNLEVALIDFFSNFLEA